MFECMKNMGYEIMDECYAVVSGRCGDGIFLTLDNGEKAYAHRFGNLFPGTQVICRIDRLPTNNKNTLVSISSVCSYDVQLRRMDNACVSDS